MPCSPRSFSAFVLIQVAQGISKFAFALIDGNQLLFAHELAARGYRGGQSAAKCVRAYISAQASSFGSLVSGTQALLVVVFASLARLAMLHRDSEEHGGSDKIVRFMHGFDSTDPMSFFENTDHITISIEKSLGRVFDRLLDHDGCQRLIFLGPTWQRFASYVNNEPRPGHANAIWKTHAIPAPPFLRAVPLSAIESVNSRARGFGECSSSTKTPLERCPAHFQSNPPPDAGSSAVEKSKEQQKVHADRTGPLTTMYPPIKLSGIRSEQPMQRRLWGVTAMREGSFERSTTEEDSRRHQKSRKEKGTSPGLGAAGARAKNSIPRNQNGKRIDLPIDFVPAIRVALQGQGYCNNFHLRGSCDFGDRCRHKHGDLTPHERAALSVLARGSPCRFGTACRDERCYSGHMCPYNPCRAIGGECYYPAEMHFDDVQPVMPPAIFD